MAEGTRLLAISATRSGRKQAILSAPVLAGVVLLAACAPATAPKSGPSGLPGLKAGSGSAARRRAATEPRRPSEAASITGFGALVDDWNRVHTPDHDFAAGSVYDPDPELPSINGHTGAVYVLVSPSDGRILSYAMNLPAGTSLRTAIASAGRQFPPDARILWTARRDLCVQAQFASRLLGRALAVPIIGDPRGLVMVEFEDIDDRGNDVAGPQRFNSASFDLGGTGSPGASPTC